MIIMSGLPAIFCRYACCLPGIPEGFCGPQRRYAPVPRRNQSCLAISLSV